MSMNCEILDLRAFLLVAESRSFHRAAETLHVSQPALSRRIQKLEQAIGSPLLERTTRSVATTAVGENLLPLVRRMLEEFDGSLFAQRGDQIGSQITIACLPTAAFYFLPSVMARFHADYPNVRFRILDIPATDGLQAVERGEVEFGINFMGASDPNLAFDVLVEDPFVLACRRDHPLAKKRKIAWSDLEKHQLITVHRTSGNRTLLDGALARENLKLSWFYEVTHLSTSLGMVEAGIGVSVLPQMATPQGDHPTLVTRPIGSPVVSRTIGIVRRRGAMLSPMAERFLQMLQKQWKPAARAAERTRG
ncbi:LysR family transcriptional regulator [Pseudoxanthomonas sp. JBR18]|uniref:LysR family transcriptional regulator n=1 Tax=Pseudoxanthomonas sp. JBR18 TaxID=2969308 RepID=UPI002305139D|nr:LysR family transcriptional regulator [Pseudoxanthomonas sp. JBR18]WCE04981.1 LysR family transcriptional regulator [Pseudoxanthomonas sp. JBR18]